MKQISTLIKKKKKNVLKANNFISSEIGRLFRLAEKKSLVEYVVSRDAFVMQVTKQAKL